jgi:hypothetical protein
LREIEGDPRHVVARKRELEVWVRFAHVACTVQSPEGVAHARPGDAILTGSSGEQWRVSREHFAAKYRPAPSTASGQAGAYISLAVRVIALQMSEPFEVLLVDGKSRLAGRSGDWLVDYGDGSLGVVSRDIFPATYEIRS